MKNNLVQCPICNKYIIISNINEHLDSNCQSYIVNQQDDIVENKSPSLNSNSSHSFTNSIENKKTVQTKLFSPHSSRKRNSNDDHDEILIHKNSSNSSSSTEKFNDPSIDYIFNPNHPYNKKIKLKEEKISLSKFDDNNNYNDNIKNLKYNQSIKPIGKESKKKQLPLAELARPKTLEEFFGQEELLGQHSILKKLIEENKVPSLIFWGPPGVGKTCLARIIANHNNTFFREVSGAIHTLTELKNASEECANHLKLTGKKGILFIDEIHRYNKFQQDSLLPYVEHGSFTLIGATTENPSFKLKAALLSRCRVFQLKQLSEIAVRSIIERAIKIKLELYHKNLIVKTSDTPESQSVVKTNILSNNTTTEASPTKSNTTMTTSNNSMETMDNVTLTDPIVSSSSMTNTTTTIKDSENTKPSEEKSKDIYVDKEALGLLAVMSDGDARNALNIVDMVLNSVLSEDTKNEITKDMIKMALQKTQLLYDNDGEEHNNLISAFHESIRGSDADATIYWLGRMIYAGEDPLYIARRLIRVASEDIGYGDNYALTLAINCYQACQLLGMPECDVILAHTSVYMARAKKSVEVYKALCMVKEVMQNEINYPVPLHLRCAPTELMKKLGYGVGLLYVPNYEEPVEQEYLPKELKCRRFLGVFEEKRRKAYEEKKRLEQEQKQKQEQELKQKQEQELKQKQEQEQEQGQKQEQKQEQEQEPKHINDV